MQRVDTGFGVGMVGCKRSTATPSSTTVWDGPSTGKEPFQRRSDRVVPKRSVPGLTAGRSSRPRRRRPRAPRRQTGPRRVVALDGRAERACGHVAPTRLTVQPPKPAPVNRAATTPSRRAGDLDERVELGRAHLEQVAQRGVARGEEPADLGEVAAGQRRARSRARGRSPRRRARPGARRPDPSGPRAASSSAVVDVAQRADRRIEGRDRGDGALAIGAPLVVGRTPRAGATSRCGRRRARTRRAAAGPAATRATGSRGGSRDPATPHADANWSMSPHWTPT